MEYELVVYYKEKDGCPHIAVDYLFADGKRVFQTHYKLPDVPDEETGIALMPKIAEWLGNSLLISTPGFRKHIHIEDKD